LWKLRKKESTIIADTKWKNITNKKDISQAKLVYDYYNLEQLERLNLRVVYFDLERQ